MLILRSLPAFLVLAAVAGCAPVLDRDLMQQGAREFDPKHLVETPEVFKDKLFIFGGVIVETKLVGEGSQIEALFVPVDGYGHLLGARYQGRFLAVYPRDKGMLDPVIYKRGREITVAANFTEVRKKKIDEMEVALPVFEIRQVHLWEEYHYYPYPAYYYYPYSYPYYYPYPYLYDPWMRPYPYPYPR